MTNLATIYKDVGTTGALPGDSVRMFLDTNGLTLGSELVSVRSVDGDPTGGPAFKNYPISFASSPVDGKWYQVSYRVEGYSGTGTVGLSGNPIVGFSAVPLTTTGIGQNGVVSFIGLKTSGSPLLFTRDTNTANFRDISVRELPGLHADQPTTSLQPVLGRSPVSRRNLLTWSEDFTNAAWNKGSDGVVTANSVMSPVNDLTADAVTYPTTSSTFGRITQSLAGNFANSHTFSVWLKRPAGSGARTIRLAVSDVTTSTKISSTTETVTEAWQRFTYTTSTGNNTGQVGVGFAEGVGGTPIAFGETLHIWGGQLELGSTATAYQKVKSQYDITEPGVPSYSYLRFDAVDDKLPQVYPTAKTGTAMIFGRNGSWDCGSVSVAAGGTLNVINGKDGPSTPGIIPALGDIVAWYHAPQTLNAYQKAKLTEYFMERGAKGLLVPSGVELVTNGTFNTDTSGWTAQSDAVLSVQGGAMRVSATSPDTLANAIQSVMLEANTPYLAKYELKAQTGSSIIRLDPTANSQDANNNLFSVTGMGIGAASRVVVPKTTQAFYWQLWTTGDGSYADFDNISLQKLVIA